MHALVAILAARNIKPKRKARSFYNNIPKMIDWFELIVPQLPPSNYKYFFRISRDQYQVLKDKILNINHIYLSKGLVPISKRIHLVLYFLGHNAEVMEMSDRFNLGVGTVQKYTTQMVEVLSAMFTHEIKWPNQNCKSQIIAGFRRMGGINNCVGAIDGTHINIQGVGEYRAAYTTRKLSYAINLTVISDCSKRICYAIVGAPGSYNDSRVFSYTPFAEDENTYLVNDEVLFGDSGYTLTDTMIMPYSNPNEQQMSFNYLHSKMRVIVENCFGLLKGKWKILGTTIRFKKLIKKVVDITRACMVLHNICIGEDIPDLDLAAHQIALQGSGELRESNQRSNARLNRSGMERREDMRINFE